MDRVFEPSNETDPFAVSKSQKSTNVFGNVKIENFDGRKIIHESWDFIIQQWVKADDENKDAKANIGRKSFIGQVDYESVNEYHKIVWLSSLET